jgi:hypothetical protein
MNDQRQVCRAGRRDVGAETLGLCLAWRVVIKIVETGFTDTHTLRMGSQFNEVPGGDVEFFMRVVRMGSHREEHLPVCLGDGAYGVISLHACRDRHHQMHTGLMGTRDNGIDVLAQHIKVEMAVTVDDRRWCHGTPLLCPVMHPQFHRRSAETRPVALAVLCPAPTRPAIHGTGAVLRQRTTGRAASTLHRG